MSELKKQIEKTSLLPEGFATPCGDRIAPIFEEVFDEETKKKVVKKTGEFDIYEEIQMSSNGSEIAMLKRQAKVSGVPVENDPGLISGVNQSLVPNNIHEAMAQARNIQDAFGRLPADVQKELYKGDAQAYYKDVMDGTVLTSINGFYGAKQAAAAQAATETGGAE